MAAFVGFAAVGCYNDFDMPAPAHVYTDADFADARIMSIKEVKEMFYTAYPFAGHGAVGKSMKIDENIVFRGKVISSDRANNIYKSLYIFDNEVSDASDAAAIELKLNTGNYIFWPVGTRVYVKLQGLVLGDYRGMLSVGIASQQSNYANNSLTGIDIDRHVFTGEQLAMTQADTLVVTADNYRSVLRYDTNDTYMVLGRLVRFEGVRSKFGKAQWGYQNTFPNYFANSTSYDKNSPDILNENIPDELQWRNIDQWATYAAVRDMPTQGVAFKSTPFYGSAWFTYGDISQIPGNYVVRTSGYARFREHKIPADGTKVDLTAIYTLYTGSYSDGGRDAYQLALNRVEDVVEVE